MNSPQVPPGADTVLVRVGEVGTKSESVRYRMQGHLGDTLSALLDWREVAGTVVHRRNRPLIRTSNPSEATRVATDAMGVVSASPAVSTEPTLEAIEDELATVARTVYDAGTFAVRANRRGDLDFDTRTVESDGGAAIWSAVADRFDPAVDLEEPDHTFFVDVDDREAFVFIEKVPGPGGLPIGSQRALVALVSGGIDSPVAAYEAIRRGSPVVPVYVDLGDFGGPDHVERAVETTAVLASYAPHHVDTLWRVPAGDVATDLADAMESGRMLSLRRFMYRAAGHIARRVDAAGIVTGEAIGQKSSQTAGNLAVTDVATEFPVHRPLLSMDKHEIIERAKSIGTYESASIDAGCSRFAPDSVATNASIRTVRAAEPDDLFERAEEAAEAAEPIDLDGYRDITSRPHV
ncbi:MAG: tRNA sulfurtransferase [Natronomonas sp.]